MTIPKTQKQAAVRKLGGKVEIIEAPVPTPGPRQVLAKILYTSVCQSDLHTNKGVATGADGKPILNVRLPNVAGHEGVATVVEVGSEVTSNVKVGDLVGVRFTATVCRECEFCLKGQEQYCPNATNHLHHLPGAFQEYIALDTGYLTRLPPDIDASVIGPVLCAGVTTWSSIKKANPRAGSWAVVVGAGGGLGHLAVQYLKAIGVRVIAIDGGNDKLEMCLGLGAEYAFDFSEAGLVDRVLKVTKGGAETVMVTAASARAFTSAPEYLRTGGTLCCCGIPSDNAVIHIPVATIVIRGWTIIGNLVGNMQEVNEAVDFTHRGLVKPIVTIVQGLEKLPECYDLLEQGKVTGRLVIKV